MIGTGKFTTNSTYLPSVKVNTVKMFEIAKAYYYTLVVLLCIYMYM